MGHILSHPITSKNLQRKGTKSFKIGSAEMQGFRVNMEDTHCIETVLDPKKHPNVSFFGIYDGHAGTAASEFCAAHMHKRVASFSDPTDSKQLIDAVLKADAEFLTNDEASRAHGSTSVFALVKPKEKAEQKGAKEWLVTVANVGDSRAMLIRTDGSVEALTEDHKPDLPKEKERIEAAGGSVSMNRVDGQLAMSRAIGDWTYKNNTTRAPEDQKVIAVPEIRTVTAEPNELLLIACDGIFEQMTNEEVAALVSKQYQEQPSDKKDPAIVAAALLDASLRKGSKDNHSAMIIAFEDGSKYDAPDEFLAGPFNPYANDRQFRDAYIKDGQRFGIDQDRLMELAAEAEKGMNLQSPPFGGSPGGALNPSRTGGEEEEEDQGGNPAAIRITQEQLMTLTQLPEVQKLLFLKALIQSQVNIAGDETTENEDTVDDGEPAVDLEEEAPKVADKKQEKQTEAKTETTKENATEPKSGKAKKKKKKNKNKKK